MGRATPTSSFAPWMISRLRWGDDAVQGRLKVSASPSSAACTDRAIRQRIFWPPTRLEGASRVDLRDKPRAFPLASASGSLEEEPSCRGLRIRRLHALRRVAGAPAVQIGLPERNISSSGGIGRRGESEEPRSGPARARDLPGNAGQRSMEFPLKLETILGDDHRMGSSMPLSDEARPGFDPRF